MKAVATKSDLTGRITRLSLKPGSFEDERILGMILDGLATDGTLFELTKDGESVGSFTFGGRKEDSDNA